MDGRWWPRSETSARMVLDDAVRPPSCRLFALERSFPPMVVERTCRSSLSSPSSFSELNEPFRDGYPRPNDIPGGGCGRGGAYKG